MIKTTLMDLSGIDHNANAHETHDTHSDTVLCALWLCGERVHKQIQDAVKTSRSSLDKARLARKLALWHALPNAYVCDRSAQP